MNKAIIVMLILFMVTIASSGCTDSNTDQNATTELNRTGSGDESGSDSTGGDSTNGDGSTNGGGSDGSKSGNLIDTGKTTGPDGLIGGSSFTYEWKTYKINDKKLIIYSTYTQSDGYTVKQTNTLEIDPDNPEMVNMITVVPKVTGRSSWQHITGNQGYTNLLDYYWKIFRPKWLMEGPIH